MPGQQSVKTFLPVVQRETSERRKEVLTRGGKAQRGIPHPPAKREIRRTLAATVKGTIECPKKICDLIDRGRSPRKNLLRNKLSIVSGKARRVTHMRKKSAGGVHKKCAPGTQKRKSKGEMNLSPPSMRGDRFQRRIHRNIEASYAVKHRSRERRGAYGPNES